MGIFGGEKATDYHKKLSELVKRILRGDLLGLHRRLPKRLMHSLYQAYSRISRQQTLVAERALTTSLTPDDYHLAEADDRCFDWVFIANR